MQSLIDALIYLAIIGGAVTIVGSLVYGIHRLTVRIRHINTRLIWRVVARHRHV